METQIQTRIDQLLNQNTQLWRASQLGSGSQSAVHSGFPELDHELPGQGWPSATLIELLINRSGVGELRFLMPALQRMALENRKIILLAPPHQPFAPAFEQFGIPLSSLLIVQANNPADKLWAVEQIMQSDSFGMSIAWLPEEKVPARTDQLRRLQMAANRSQGLSFVIRPAKAQLSSSPAPLRLFLSAAGPNHIRVELLKRRGPVIDQPLTLHLPRPNAWLPRAYLQADMQESWAHSSFSTQCDQTIACPQPSADKVGHHAMDRVVTSPYIETNSINWQHTHRASPSVG
jgi:hypothetical protein